MLLFYFGVDYYPEHWSPRRWPEDVKMMKEAGFNTVRLAEFAWSKMEPQEGTFEFGWLDEIIGLLNENEIKTVLGTPTAAIPAWLAVKFPELLRCEESGERVTYGLRQQACVNNADYREAGLRIVNAMADRYGKSDAVIGWQVDNELGKLCYCPVCQKKFQDWLKNKYHRLEKLNDVWGTSFWSHEYRDWSEIPLPWSKTGGYDPGLALDYRRYMADSFVAFSEEQIAVLREKSPGRFVTHNFMGLWPEDLDYTALCKSLDFPSWDNYPLTGTGYDPVVLAANNSITRNFKSDGTFWVMEMQSGPIGWDKQGPTPAPGLLRLWTHQSVAHGADGIIYYRWRPCRWGVEQHWHGILNYDGNINRRYEEIAATGMELSQIGDLIAGSKINAEVAIINDYPSRWAFHYQKTNELMSYHEQILDYFRALHKLNVPVDIVSPDADLSKYKLVIAPSLFVLTPQVAGKFDDFVYEGGMLVASFRTGVKDEYGAIHDEPFPAMMLDVFGISLSEYHSPSPDEENFITGSIDDLPQDKHYAQVWLDVLRDASCTVLAKYAGGYTDGTPAITYHEWGEGKAVYVGTWPDQEFLDQFCAWLLDKAEVEPTFDTPFGVETVVREKDGKRFLFIINHHSEPKEVEIGPGWRNLLEEKEVNEMVKLEASGIVVLESTD